MYDLCFRCGYCCYACKELHLSGVDEIIYLPLNMHYHLTKSIIQ